MVVVVTMMVMVMLAMIRLGAVRAAGAAGLGAGAEGFRHDLADRPGAAAALGAAAEATINLAGGAGRNLGAGYDASHVVIADDVTGTNDHGENFRLLMILNG